MLLAALTLPACAEDHVTAPTVVPSTTLATPAPTASAATPVVGSSSPPSSPRPTVAPASTDVTGSSDGSGSSTTGTAATTTTVFGPVATGEVSMTQVPADVLVPTSDESLDATTNPINGRRSGARIRDMTAACADVDGESCLVVLLDRLGFDVGGTEGAERDDRIRRAIAVVQLDAGLPATGSVDDALGDHLALLVAAGAVGASVDEPAAFAADEQRVIGTSQQGRPIVAFRYGDGTRTVLVVAQTHGDEEGGLRVVLRARTLAIPPDVTLWVVPTMNPDGWALDTRFLADGADPNRAAPSGVEQHAIVDFAMEVRPSLSIWYHQNYGWVGGSGASFGPAQRYQELTELGTLKRSGDCASRGFVWCPIDAALGASSILVELPDIVTPADVHRHAEALLAVVGGSS